MRPPLERLLLALLLLSAAAAPALSGTELILKDGRVLEGTACYREGGNYVLTLENGEEIAFPEELVQSVALSGEGQPAEEPESESGTDRSPGYRYTEPETIAGAPPQLGDRRRALEALGPPARFPRDIVDSRWKPTSDWEMDPAKNDFHPATWASSPVDPKWEPRSAWDTGRDVLAPRKSHWPDSIIDSTWTPTDGFKGGGS